MEPVTCPGLPDPALDRSRCFNRRRSPLAMSNLKNNVLVIGCGHWGKNYVRVFSDLLGQAHVGITDARPATVAEIQRQYQHVRAYRDLGQALESRQFRMAVVAAPASLHYELVASCFDAELDV